jgi:hypothetical protein
MEFVFEKLHSAHRYILVLCIIIHGNHNSRFFQHMEEYGWNNNKEIYFLLIGSRVADLTQVNLFKCVIK